jgi:aspartyl protease family protein
MAVTAMKGFHMLWFTRTYHAVVMLFVLLCLAVGGCSNASAASLRDQLRELAQSEGFEIRGLGLVTREPGQAVRGDLRHRIKRLLSGYNYVVLDNDAGDIEKVIILARGTGNTVYPELSVINTVTVPGEHIIPARRRGSHQLVEAVLVGPGQVPQSVSLLVDTGASTVVLPMSMAAQMGFAIGDLRDGWTQTANGRVRAKTGVLQSVAVGSAAAQDVTVTFLDDNRLNGARLLGMSFLQRFRMTIDDANSRIILTSE